MVSKLTSRIRATVLVSLAALVVALGVAAPAAHAHDTQMDGTVTPAAIVDRERVPAAHTAALDEWRAAMPPATGEGNDMSCQAAMIAASIHRITGDALIGNTSYPLTTYFWGLADGMLRASCPG